MDIFLAIAAALLFAAGGLCMKYADGLRQPLPSLAVLLFFCAGAACQTIAMRRAEMSVVYIGVLGLEAIAALVLSGVVLGERVGAARIGAVALILAGIVWLKRT